MTRYVVNALASGLPSGTLVTTSPQNLPPVNTISRSGTPSIPSQVSDQYGGLGGISVVSGGSASGTEFLRHSVGSSTQAGIVIVFRVPLLPGAAIDWFRLDSTGATQTFTLGISSGNLLQLKNAAGAVLASYATALTAGTWYILEGDLIVGSSTTNGTLRARLWNIAGTTQLWSASFDANTNTGTASLSLVRLPGDHGSTPNVTFAYWTIIDNGVSVGSKDWIDRTLTAAAGPDQTVEPGTTVVLDATSSVAALGRQAAGWTQVGGPSCPVNAPGQAATYFTAPYSVTQQTYTYRWSMTDYDLPTGKSAQDDVVITVLPATETMWDANGVEIPAPWFIL